MLIEQIKAEKGGAALSPVRVFIDGDQNSTNMLLEECVVEDTIDKNSEFPYQDFLCMLHKRIRALLTA